MANIGFRGIDVYQSGSNSVGIPLRFQVLSGSPAAPVTTVSAGNATITILEEQFDATTGALTYKTFEWNATGQYTFKTTALTPTVNVSHITNGIWGLGVIFANLSAFTREAHYFIIFNHPDVGQQCRHFQYGGAQGDLSTLANAANYGAVLSTWNVNTIDLLTQVIFGARTLLISGGGTATYGTYAVLNKLAPLNGYLCYLTNTGYPIWSDGTNYYMSAHVSGVTDTAFWKSPSSSELGAYTYSGTGTAPGGNTNPPTITPIPGCPPLHKFSAYEAFNQDGTTYADLRDILGTQITGNAAQIVAAFIKLLDVASPVLTAASVNQTGDAYPIANNGTYGNAALLTAVQNVQNNTFVQSTIPQELLVPSSGSATVAIVFCFADETGTAKNLDSGNPTIALVNDANADKSGRLGAWTNPATGKYVINYTNTSSDTVEGLHWDATGTINGKLRRYVAYTQLISPATGGGGGGGQVTGFTTDALTEMQNALAVQGIGVYSSTIKVGKGWLMTVVIGDDCLISNKHALGGFAVPDSSLVGSTPQLLIRVPGNADLVIQGTLIATVNDQIWFETTHSVTSALTAGDGNFDVAFVDGSGHRSTWIVDGTARYKPKYGP